MKMYVDSHKLKRIISQRNAIQNWLETNGSFTVSEQKQLNAESPERLYWHYGYQAALTDLINLMVFDRHEDGNADIPN